MIIERHMPHLCGSLPFIDHATEMRTGDITETKVELEAEPIDMESWKSQLDTIEETIQWFHQGLGYFDRVAIEDFLQQMAELTKKVYDLGAPKSTNEEGAGSISRKQQIGVKRGEAINISQ